MLEHTVLARINANEVLADCLQSREKISPSQEMTKGEMQAANLSGAHSCAFVVLPASLTSMHSALLAGKD